MSMFRRPIHAGFALLALLVFSAAGCGHPNARAKLPAPPASIGSSEAGVASWYGVPYHGRRAASGEIYDMEKFTAAHRTLPFQTWVEVTNATNGKHVDVRITDRGPFAHGRIIDLSHAAAREIDMLGAGTAHVRLRVIVPPREERPEAAVGAAAPAGIEAANSSSMHIDWYVVQAGAFADRERAEALRVTLEEQFAEARVIAGSRNLWRVVAGREMTLDQANELAVRVRKEIGAALVVPEPGGNVPQEPSTPQSPVTPR